MVGGAHGPNPGVHKMTYRAIVYTGRRRPPMMFKTPTIETLMEMVMDIVRQYPKTVVTFEITQNTQE